MYQELMIIPVPKNPESDRSKLSPSSRTCGSHQQEVGRPALEPFPKPVRAYGCWGDRPVEPQACSKPTVAFLSSHHCDSFAGARSPSVILFELCAIHIGIARSNLVERRIQRPWRPASRTRGFLSSPESSDHITRNSRMHAGPSPVCR